MIARLVEKEQDETKEEVANFATEKSNVILCRFLCTKPVITLFAQISIDFSRKIKETSIEDFGIEETELDGSELEIAFFRGNQNDILRKTSFERRVFRNFLIYVRLDGPETCGYITGL